MEVHLHSSWVTPGPTGQMPTGSTVRDRQSKKIDGGPASRIPRGDVRSTHQIPVGDEETVWTEKVPSFWFGDSTKTTRTGRRGSSLVDEHDFDAGHFGLVRKTPDQSTHPPFSNRQVLAVTRVFEQQGTGITHHKGVDLVLSCERDDSTRRLVAGLIQASEVPGFGLLLPSTERAPPA